MADALELPTTPGMYVSGRVDFDTAEPFALTTYFGWIWFRGGQVTPQELEQLTPMVPVIAFTEDERSRIHECAIASRDALRLHAAGLEHWGARQPAITAVLTEADHWRAIAEKTGAR